MKKTLLLAAATVLFPASGLAQNYLGNLDGVSCANIIGWAWYAPYQTASVDIYDGSAVAQAGVAANLANSDSVDAWGVDYPGDYEDWSHGFSITLPAGLLDGRLHQIYAKFSGTQINLGGGPLAVQCTVKSQGYAYYYQSTFGDPGNWNSNGTVSTASNVFSSSSEGSWISGVGVPDGTSNYEVRTTLSLQQGGGTYVEYLRATGNAISGQGTAIQVTLSDPQFSGGGCTAALTVSDMVNGSSTQDAQWTVPCVNGMEWRTVVQAPSGGVSGVGVIVGGQEYWCQTSIVSAGQPGIGAINTPSGNGLTLAEFGPLDSEAPGNVNPGSVETYLTPSEVDLSWAGVADNPNDGNGVGLSYYVVYRDGSLIGVSTSADYTDTNVNPGDSHTYQIYAEDWHGNWSSPASVAINVPAAGSVDPRRVGVLGTGNYWGAMGEQIDALSGNLNFSIALLKAMGRGGWSVPIGLSYNSQNWRQEGSTSWIMGADVGYGFGWQLMAGSIRPYWNGWALDHFVFTDATGAQYRLDQQNGNVWSSKQSIYVWYDYSTSLLHFKDGSYWYMGCTSSGEEEDAGAMYPTLMEDSNGNYISISYLPGAGPYASNGAGTNPPDSSARISRIQDARPGAYSFTYNSDQINHLTSITNNYGTSEKYTFTVSNNQGLFSPFTNTSACGSTNSNCGYAGFLSSVTRTGVNLTTSFAYDPNGYGDLTQVTFPYSGHLRWSYRNFTYAGNRTLQEVAERYLLKDATAAETTYAMQRNDSLDETLPIHSALTLIDPSGAPNNPGKLWSFNYNSGQPWMMGTASQIESRNFYGATGQHLDVMTRSQDAGGNPYISQQDTYLDEGTGNQRHSYTTTTLDAHGYGNVISSQVYDYAANGSSPALLRTTTITYLNDSSGNGQCAVRRGVHPEPGDDECGDAGGRVAGHRNEQYLR